MAETIDELTVNWADESGQQLVREVKKTVLTRGAWSTVMFMYQELDKKTGEFGPNKIRIARFQKRNGRFLPQSKFNISSANQAKQILEILQTWLPEMDAEEGEAVTPD